MCVPGDIIAARSPTAGKHKYHLCISEPNEYGVQQFLFVNSDDGYRCDLTFPDGSIENLPKSDTGKTVVSFSDIVRFSKKELELFQAQKVSTASKAVLEAVIVHAEKVSTLNRRQRRELIETFSAIIEA